MQTVAVSAGRFAILLHGVLCAFCCTEFCDLTLTDWTCGDLDAEKCGNSYMSVSTSCEDTDAGAVLNHGYTFRFYYYYAEDDCNGFLWPMQGGSNNRVCGATDDDFNSSSMCCLCGGGRPMRIQCYDLHRDCAILDGSSCAFGADGMDPGRDCCVCGGGKRVGAPQCKDTYSGGGRWRYGYPDNKCQYFTQDPSRCTKSRPYYDVYWWSWYQANDHIYYYTRFDHMTECCACGGGMSELPTYAKCMWDVGASICTRMAPTQQCDLNCVTAAPSPAPTVDLPTECSRFCDKTNEWCSTARTRERCEETYTNTGSKHWRCVWEDEKCQKQSPDQPLVCEDQSQRCDLLAEGCGAFCGKTRQWCSKAGREDCATTYTSKPASDEHWLCSWNKDKRKCDKAIPEEPMVCQNQEWFCSCYQFCGKTEQWCSKAHSPETCAMTYTSSDLKHWPCEWDGIDQKCRKADIEPTMCYNLQGFCGRRLGEVAPVASDTSELPAGSNATRAFLV